VKERLTWYQPDNHQGLDLMIGPENLERLVVALQLSGLGVFLVSFLS
jgi:hypothetical protein